MALMLMNWMTVLRRCLSSAGVTCVCHIRAGGLHSCVSLPVHAHICEYDFERLFCVVSPRERLLVNSSQRPSFRWIPPSSAEGRWISPWGAVEGPRIRSRSKHTAALIFFFCVTSFSQGDKARYQELLQAYGVMKQRPASAGVT